MDDLTAPGASLPSTDFDTIRDGGWSIESQLSRMHYSKSGRRYGLTYAELLLRSLEVASTNAVEREICARIALYAYYSPDMIEHAMNDRVLAEAVADRAKVIRADMGADGGPEIASRAEFAIEVAIKRYFDEARDKSRRRQPSADYPVLYFNMDFEDSMCCCASALERVLATQSPPQL